MLLEALALLLGMEDHSRRELPFPLVKPALLTGNVRNFVGHDFNVARSQKQQEEAQRGLQGLPAQLFRKRVAVEEHPVILNDDAIIVGQELEESQQPRS